MLFFEVFIGTNLRCSCVNYVYIINNPCSFTELPYWFSSLMWTAKLGRRWRIQGRGRTVRRLFVHTANSRNTWCTATIYILDLMTPWEVCRSCNECNDSLFAQSCTCLCVKAQENTEVQHCGAEMHFISKQRRN